MVIGSGHGIDRDSYSAVFPSTSGTHGATGTVGHRQAILRPECRRVSLVSGGRNCVRDRSSTGPVTPHVPNTRAAVLRGSRGNSMA